MGDVPVGAVVGIGVDLVDVERMRATIARTPGIVERVFTDGEAAWATSVADGAERFAARFAAKEAVLKALGAGLGAAPLTDIEVVRESSGAPRIVLHGAAAALAAERGIGCLQVSLSHTATSAIAMVVAVAGGGDGTG